MKPQHHNPMIPVLEPGSLVAAQCAPSAPMADGGPG